MKRLILLHGTTRLRAERILEHGPDPRYREPGAGILDEEDGFSMNLEDGPFLFGHPEEYARGKASDFPDEGGPAILVLSIPEEIVLRAVNDWFPLDQGLVQFNTGSGLEELLAAWGEVSKTGRIRSVP